MIAAALERLKRSQTFGNSARLLHFLDFVVAARLRGEELKETSIGVGLYGRDPSYDTKIDSIVRTQARRVRERLEEYYKSEGAADPIVLQIPKGGYVPVVENRATDAPVPSAESAAAQSQPAVQTRWRGRSLAQALPIAGVLLALVAGVTAYVRWTRPSASPRVLNYTQITRDGRPKWLVGTDGARLFLGTGNFASPGFAQVPASGGEPVPIPLPAAGLSPFDVSSDGEQVLLGDYYPGRLWSLPLLTGSARRLGVASGNDAAWSPDGKALAYCKDDDLYIADSGGMNSRKVASVPSRRMYAPRWSPDGSRLRFTLWEKERSTPSLWEVSADGTGLHPLLPNWHKSPDEQNGRWTADGKYFVFQSQGQIWALRDKKGVFGRAADKPVQLTNSPLNLDSPIPSRDGKRLFVVGRSFRGSLAHRDAKSGRFVPFLSGISAEYVSFSPDGEWVAYVTYPDGVLWRSRKDGSSRLRLSDLSLYLTSPRWSPDGKRIACFSEGRGTTPRIYTFSFDGGTPELFNPNDPDRLGNPSWFPDGTRMAFDLDLPRGASEIRVMDLVTQRVSTVRGSQGTYNPVVSPDGRHLVAIRKEPISLVSFDFQTQRWSELARVTGGFPSWSRDGKYVYFLRFPDHPAVLKIRVSDRDVETVADLADFPLTGHWGCWLGLTPDDSPLLLRDTGTQDVYALDWEAP